MNTCCAFTKGSSSLILYLYHSRGGHQQYYSGVTNNQLFFLFKTITSYTSSGFTLVKNVVGRFKIKLEMLKSYKS
jgi:hypothetical protein